ncbi:MAG: TatD family hydrolase [Candidatus Dormibacteria bacterium]
MTPASFIDTHCHLTLLEDRGVLDEAMESARSAGVETMVTIGVDLGDSDRNRAIAERHDSVWFAVGWDPQQTRPPDAGELCALAELLRHPRAVAVGEVGLDCFFRPGYHDTALDVQQRSLRTMLELAAEAEKPVVIHDRDAHEEILDALADVPGVRGVMHCFTAGAAHMRRCVERGFAVSFSGIVTFPRSEDVQDAARQAPDDMFVVETDAPFLTPVPHRGTVNMPARIVDTARRVASLRDDTVESVAALTSANARRIFGLDAH